MKRPSKARRQFLKTSAAVSAGYWVAGGVSPKESRSAIEEVRFACVGVGGKGQSDSDDAARAGKIVAICDIDDSTIAKRKEDDKFKDAKVFHDFRKLFDEVGNSIDAVTVSTPDHLHGFVAAMAMKNKKACFCQKPLTKTIWEARRLAEIAQETGVATQMGNQGSEKTGLREAAAKIKAGVIGNVKEVHVWTNRPVWPQGIPRPKGEPVPANIHWDEYIGPEKMRDYSPAYHPFKWRGFWAFGTGALGDMACHTLNMPFAGCDLTNPVAVKARTSGHNSETFPANSLIEFDFAATDKRPPLKVFWYDGGRKVDPALLEGQKMRDSGSLVIGDKGKIFSPDDYGAEYYLLGGATDKEVDVEKSPGHFREWVQAIKGGKPAWSNFANYAGKLTEVILLGNLAVWAAGEAKEGVQEVESPLLEWDQAALKVKGTEQFDWMIKPNMREGYENIF
jgi:predicted dehydrogenase